jgi:rSAM/selenodomain-associated transferase 2
MSPTVAIIIPVLNERMFIIEALQRVSCLGADEIIVVDGNSIDGTYESVKERFPYVRCLKMACANRALQMNAGAKEALSDILVFFHADSRLPVHSINNIQSIMKKGYVGGGFMKKYEPANVILNIYGFLINYIYLGLYKNLVGSNAIFIRRDLFESLKGFPEVNFMEDVLFAKILKEAGRLSVIDEPVIVSSRRYQKNGVLKQIVRNVRIMFDYQYLQRDPQELRKVYTANA